MARLALYHSIKPDKHVACFYFLGFADRKCWKNSFGMFWHANSIPIVLCKASWCGTIACWFGEGERITEDILARLADGKCRFEENEFKLFFDGKALRFTVRFHSRKLC